ncbi:ATP-binding protein [Jiangella ureilytica]|uniref:ATP-binding protein n=1 Tax=Jiangella ureilytica TaxID=2530374 RepID=UPI00193E489C|nr:ATP-binding protein [Jiangella ureilytica]
MSAIVSKECLSLLEGVGRAVLDLELRMLISRRNPLMNVAQRDAEKARLIGPVRRDLVEILRVTDNSRLGAGEWQAISAGSGARTVETVMLQVLGWWSLMLPGGTISRLVDQIHADLGPDTTVGYDWRTMLSEHFGKLAPEFFFSEQGPDHTKLFQATVRTSDGRSSTGSVARSKKEAARLASQAYLTAHAPRLLASRTSSDRKPPLSELPVHMEHRRLAGLFDTTDARLFAKALTHKSWVYENTPHGDRRASNEVLANLGSAVLGVLAARARSARLLSSTTRPDPDLSTGLTVPDEDLVPLAHDLGLPAACRLGAGQRRLGMTTEMLANFVQGVLAAAYVQAPGITEFERRLPAVVAEFLAAHSRRSTRDAATRLQELAVELDLEWRSTDRSTGPGHAVVYHNTTWINGGSATIVVEGYGAGRTAAKKAAAAQAIGSANLRVGATDFEQRDVALFFLVRQIEVLAAKPRLWPRWQQANVLGAGYLANLDWAAFANWTDAVRAAGLLDSQFPAETRHVLADYYQRAVRSAYARPSFAAVLTRVLRWVEAAREQNRAILEPEQWEEMVALTAAHSIWLAPGGTADLAKMLERWAQPDRRRASVTLDLDSPAEIGAQACAAVQRLLQEFRPPSRGPNELGLHAKLSSGPRGHEIRLSPGAVWSSGSASVVALVCEATKGVVVDTHGDETVLRITNQSVAGSGLLWDAATSTRATDQYDVEFGRLLHDLKNQIMGARMALSRPTETRTEQLEAELDASQHIDSAAAITTQLVGAEGLYTRIQIGMCNLGSFMRHYISDLMKRLPPGIRVIPPNTVPVRVALGAEVLRGALDNLVKNAVEAMGDAGQIEFEYTLLEDDRVALLEVRDTGPGLPSHVISALRRGGVAPTTKRHGSGLGLPGVIRMMRRAGCDLHPLQVAVGGAWLITLPLAEESGAADDN